MWDLIVSVPDHCLSFYFVSANCRFGKVSFGKVSWLRCRYITMMIYFSCVLTFAQALV